MQGVKFEKKKGDERKQTRDAESLHVNCLGKSVDELNEIVEHAHCDVFSSEVHRDVLDA
jgi:hypothetical protein